MSGHGVESEAADDDPDVAVRAATSAIEHARATGDAHAEGRARAQLGALRGRAGQPARALDEHAAAEALLLRAGDVRGAVEALSSQGIALRELGRLDESIACHERAARDARAAGFPALEETVLLQLGASHRHGGRLGRARECVESAVERAREGGRDESLAMALVNLTTLLQELGDEEGALARAEEAARVAGAAGLDRAEALAAGSVAWAYRKRGLAFTALPYADRAVQALERLRSTGTLPPTLLGRAHDQAMLGRMDAATHDAGRALDLARATGNERQELWALRILAAIQLRHGRLDVARENLEVALERARSTEATGDERVILRHLAEVALLRGDEVFVGRCIARAREIAERIEQMGPALLAIAAAHGGRPDRLARAARACEASEGDVAERIDARYHLWRATGDAAHLTAAREAIERVLAGLTAPEQAVAWRENRGYRRVAEAT